MNIRNIFKMCPEVDDIQKISNTITKLKQAGYVKPGPKFKRAGPRWRLSEPGIPTKEKEKVFFNQFMEIFNGYDRRI